MNTVMVLFRVRWDIFKLFFRVPSASPSRRKAIKTVPYGCVWGPPEHSCPAITDYFHQLD
jgi:hypothetical protein